MRKTKQVKLRDAFDEHGNHTLRLVEYLRFLRHVEEEPEVVRRSGLSSKPEIAFKEKLRNHIDYDSGGNTTEENYFYSTVISDLKLRKHSPSDLRSKSRAELKSLLRESHKVGRRLIQARNAIYIEEKARLTRIVAVHKAILCILHLENQTSEKVVWCLLDAALASMPDTQSKENLVTEIESIMNKDVLVKKNGNIKNSQGQWKVPLGTGHQLQEVSFSNRYARRVVKNLNLLLPVCTGNMAAETQVKWKKSIELYKLSMEQVRSRNHFNEPRLLSFQKTVDDFADLWLDLNGKHALSNYMHDLFSGHVFYFLKRYGNLYRYSQQGWEHIMGILKRTYHHSTAKGGGKGGSSKLKPLVFALLRQQFWMFGHGDDFFKNHVYPREGEYIELDVLQKKTYRQPEKLTDSEIKILARAIIDMGTDDDMFEESPLEDTDFQSYGLVGAP